MASATALGGIGGGDAESSSSTVADHVEDAEGLELESEKGEMPAPEPVPKKGVG